MCQEGGRGPEGGGASEHGENQTVGFCSVDPSNVTAPWQRLRLYPGYLECEATVT